MPNILYIDSSSNLRKYSIEYLQLQGFDAVSVSKGTDGLAYIKDNKDIDLVVCADHLSDMKAVDLIKEVRSWEDIEFQILPFIIATFEVTPEMEEVTKALGVHGFLVYKPFDAEKLRQEIDKLIKDT